MTVEKFDPDKTPEMQAFIADWRRHRRTARQLATRLGGWDRVADYLNAHLTGDDLRAEIAALPPERREPFVRQLIAEVERNDRAERHSGV